jgi:hypothetical protein
MYWKRLPKGTRVRIFQRIHQTDPSYKAETTGVIESWGEEPTGAWYAHGRNGKLWLERLRVRKADGEISVLVIDDQTRIHPIEVGTE